ncbi:MAG: FxsA family protein [Proteobacteria bacterium]|nr:FxsA family protein [Pseudomonadota bacterium]
MGAILLIVLIVVPIAEIALFIEVGGFIGFWPTMGIIILTALAGTALLRRQGLAVLRKAQASLEENRFPIDVVFDGLCLLVAGVFLLTPGFFTDTVGLLLFVPPVRAAFGRALARVLAARGGMEIHGAGLFSGSRPGNVIDGEFQDITPDGEPPLEDGRRKEDSEDPAPHPKPGKD